MHPVESTLYYSAGFLALPFGLHPVFALGIVIDCGVGAWLGHDGFQWPGNADLAHYLHTGAVAFLFLFLSASRQSDGILICRECPPQYKRECPLFLHEYNKYEYNKYLWGGVQ